MGIVMTFLFLLSSSEVGRKKATGTSLTCGGLGIFVLSESFDYDFL